METTSFSGGKLGHDVWPASVSLASWVLAHRKKFEGKKVLELGAGATGLPGLMAAKCGAEVTLTDIDGDTDDEPTMLIPTLMQNIRRNVDKKMTVADGLDWREEDPFFNDQFDVVLAADVVYDFGILEPLARTICRTLRGSGRAYVMAEDRDWTGAREPRPSPSDLVTILENCGCKVLISDLTASYPIDPRPAPLVLLDVAPSSL